MCNSRDITTKLELLVLEDDILELMRLLVGVGDVDPVVATTSNNNIKQ